MPVHKKVAKALKKVGKKALSRVGVRLQKPIKKRVAQQHRKRRPFVATSGIAPGTTVDRLVALRQAGKRRQRRYDIGRAKQRVRRK